MELRILSNKDGLNPPVEEVSPVLAHEKRVPGVLVIEDEEILRLLLEDLLGATGYRPVMACNGLEALNIYSRDKNIAIVVTDMMMPVMDGHQTISALRQVNPSVRIIAMSGSIEAAANLPRDIPFIAKPLNPDTFLQTLAGVLTDCPI